jgi:hypothetical protein
MLIFGPNLVSAAGFDQSILSQHFNTDPSELLTKYGERRDGKIIADTDHGPVWHIDLKGSDRHTQVNQSHPELSPVPEYYANGTFFLHVSALANGGGSYLRKLMINLPKSTKIVLVGTRSESDSQVRYQYRSFVRYYRERYSVFYMEIGEMPELSGHSVARWLRDSMGVPVTFKGMDNSLVNGFMSSDYLLNFPTSEPIMEKFSQQVGHLNSRFEFGNYMVADRTAFIVDGERLPKGIDPYEFAAAGVDELVILPRPKLGDDPLGIPHVDEFVTALPRPNGDIVMVTTDAVYKKIFESMGYESVMIPDTSVITLSDGPYKGLRTDWINFVNVVPVIEEVDGKIVRQIYMSQSSLIDPKTPGLTASDLEKLAQMEKEAIAVYESLGFDVILVPAGDFNFASLGGLHCATGRIPGAKPGDPVQKSFMDDLRLLF